jgi:hypothetical protein
MNGVRVLGDRSSAVARGPAGDVLRGAEARAGRARRSTGCSGSPKLHAGAFERLASARHIGKVVLSIGERT